MLKMLPIDTKLIETKHFIALLAFLKVSEEFFEALII